MDVLNALTRKTLYFLEGCRSSGVQAMSDGRIYVGNLPMDVQERDIEDLFYKYGKIRDIELKNNRGTIPFAFVRFEDPR